MRRHAGRLVAAVLAIVISTAFAAAALFAAGTLEATAINTLTLDFGKADLVARMANTSPQFWDEPEGDLPKGVEEAIAKVAGVAAVSRPTGGIWAELHFGERGVIGAMTAFTEDPIVAPWPVVEGEAAKEPTDIVLRKQDAATLRAVIGDTIDLRAAFETTTGPDGEEIPWAPPAGFPSVVESEVTATGDRIHTIPLEITGFIDPPTLPMGADPPMALIAPELADAQEYEGRAVLLTLERGADREAVAAAITAVLDQAVAKAAAAEGTTPSPTFEGRVIAPRAWADREVGGRLGAVLLGPAGSAW
jgi:hypothetical protein